MNNKQKSILNLVCSALSQLVAIAFGLILPRLFVVSYGSEVNGLLTSLSNFLVCLNLFEAGVGAASLQALYGPVGRGQWDDINGILSATNQYYRKTGRWYLICLIVLALGYPLVVASELPPLTIIGAVFFSGISNVINFYFQGKFTLLLRAEGKNYIQVNLATIINILVNLSKVLLIYLGADIVLILGAAFVIQNIQTVYLLLYIRRGYKQLNLNVEPNFDAVSQKNYALVHRIGELVFNNTDVVLITVFCGLKVVSVYSMFKMITSHLDQILNILVHSFNFLFGQTYQSDLSRYRKMIDVADSVYGAVAYAAYAVALYLFLPFMAVYTEGVTDINYVDSKLAVLFVAAALLSHTRVPMCQTVDIAGHFKQTMTRSIAETAINLVVSLVGVFLWGIYGVLLGTVVALLYRTNDFIIYANMKCLHRKPWRTYAIYLVDILVLLATTVVFRLLFGHIQIDSFLKLVAVAIPVTLVSVLMFASAQLLCFRHCRDALRAMLQKK